MAATSEHDHASPEEFWSRFVRPRVVHIPNINPLRFNNIVRDARKAIDNEIAAMRLAICNLCTYRNALSPISSLPMEVLAHIFKFLAVDLPPAMTTPSRYLDGYYVDLSRSRSNRRLGWIRMTHVCKNWRNTALLHPSLWRYIDENLTRQWRELMIARAKSTSLSISLFYNSREDDTFLAQNSFRTRVLRLQAQGHRLEETCRSLTSAAPILEELDLDGGGTTVLPAKIFATNTPSLRRVALKDVLFPWSAPIFCNLTHLRVTLRHDNDTQRPARGYIVRLPHPDHTYDHLLGALARMPGLQTLELAYCIPSRPYRTTSNTSACDVHLTRLKLLSLVGTYTQCADLISRLQGISSSCRIAFEFTGAPQQTNDLLRFFHAHARGITTPSFLTLSISRLKDFLHSSESLCVELWRICCPSEACQPNAWPTGEPALCMRFPPSAPSLAFLEQLFGVLPLEDLHVLQVAYNPVDWSADQWVNIFGRCKLVEHVSVTSRNVDHFCKALGFLCLTKGEARRASTLEQLFFWNLKSVEVCDVDFLADIAENGLKRPFNEVFMNWLSMREALMDEDDEDFSESGDDGQGSGKGDADSWDSHYVAEDVDHRLERLVITGCSITKECVDELHGFFKDVIWDQSEGIYGEESDDDDEYMYERKSMNPPSR